MKIEIRSKLRGADEAQTWLSSLRSQGKTIVFTNGCFDLLHPGHAAYLAEARALGDVLVVGLNSDESVKRLKGEKRPLLSQDERAAMLSALQAVDGVVIFSEDTPTYIIGRLKPDIHVKAGDYSAEKLPETATVRSYGGRVVIVPFVDGFSTTGLIERIRQRYCS
jgi:D-beta-D-heptose 7-phosphate kinase/D-beta-D-heptose 1-phosphate adenosyltransferase